MTISPLCTRTELLERIEEELGGLLELAGEHQVEKAGEVGTGDGDGDVGEETGGEKKIGGLGIGGIGLGVLGLACVGVGVGLVVKGRLNDPASQAAHELTGTDYRPPGYALLGVGAAMTVAGIVMVVVDVSRRAKQRKQGQGQRALVMPVISPTGIGVVGQF